MKEFIPKSVYYERECYKYSLGIQLLNKYKDLDIPLFEIESHNNIPKMRERKNSEFTNMKQALIIGIRKSLKHTPNNKTSDFLVPYTSSGCSAMCLYCYLVCNFNKCSYLRLFVNREAMMNKLIKTADNSDKPLTLEIGSNSDLILENTITNNLDWTIEQFCHSDKGFLTLPTKFHMVDSLLDLKHESRTIIRMSINPQEIIRKVEFGTSPLIQRIEAINKLFGAGYPVGILIAPIIFIENWQSLYKDMVILLKESLNPKLEPLLNFELIFMTYSYIHKAINTEAFPNAVRLYDKNLMKSRGYGKYAYKTTLRDEASIFFTNLLNMYFPKSNISYIV